jgi:hypothetical protein
LNEPSTESAAGFIFRDIRIEALIYLFVYLGITVFVYLFICTAVTTRYTQLTRVILSYYFFLMALQHTLSLVLLCIGVS